VLLAFFPLAFHEHLYRRETAPSAKTTTRFRAGPATIVLPISVGLGADAQGVQGESTRCGQDMLRRLQARREPRLRGAARGSLSSRSAPISSSTNRASCGWPPRRGGSSGDRRGPIVEAAPAKSPRSERSPPRETRKRSSARLLRGGRVGPTAFHSAPHPPPQRVYGIAEVDERPEIVLTPPLALSPPEGATAWSSYGLVNRTVPGNPEPATTQIVQGSDSALVVAARDAWLLQGRCFPAPPAVRGPRRAGADRGCPSNSPPPPKPAVTLHIAGRLCTAKPRCRSARNLVDWFRRSSYPRVVCSSPGSAGRVIMEAVIDTDRGGVRGRQRLRVVESSGTRGFNQAAKDYVRGAALYCGAHRGPRGARAVRDAGRVSSCPRGGLNLRGRRSPSAASPKTVTSSRAGPALDGLSARGARTASSSSCSDRRACGKTTVLPLPSAGPRKSPPPGKS